MVLDDLLLRTVRQWADTDAIRTPTRSLTYRGLATEVDRWTRRLAALDVAPGERVGVASRNRVAFAALYFAIARLGAVAVPHNWRLLPGELADQIAQAGDVVLIADGPTAALLDPLRGVAPTVRAWVDLDREPAHGTPPDGWRGPEQLAVLTGDLPRRDVREDDVVVQMYTSGTTGRAKGAMLSHRNLCLMVLAWSVEMPLRGGETRFLQVTPLFHVGGLMMVLLNVAHGSTLLLEPEFQPATAIRRLQQDRATHALLVPAMIRWMLLDPAIRRATFPDLELVLYGAAPCPAEHLREAIAVFCCGFLHAYGLTETAGVVTALRPAEHVRALAEEPGLLESAGRAMVGCEVRIVDPQGAEVPDGELGEITVRGPNVFVGYRDLPDETAAALRDGWLWTGDVGRIDRRGYVTIVDRSKDMILVGGENVYPSEVEAVIRQAPGVRDLAVIGVPHPVWGEAVLAVVVASEPPDGEPDADGGIDRKGAIIRFARDRLARFKCPTDVAFARELPRTPAGKVQKAVLRAPYWAGRSRAV